MWPPLNSSLVFRDVKAIPLISASRWLIKRGECTRLTWKESGEKLTFGRRVHKQNLALFLFTDAKEPQLLDSGLKIDFLTEPKECDNPVKMGDVVTIDYEGLPHIVHFKTNLVL